VPSTASPQRQWWVLVAGVTAIVVGLAAIVAAGELRLDVEKALTGGVYLKDPYRVAMLCAGIVLVAAGAAAVIASAAAAPQGVVIPAGVVATVASTAMLAFGALVFVGLSDKQRETERSAQQDAAPSSDVSPSDEPPAVDPEAESAAGAPAPEAESPPAPDPDGPPVTCRDYKCTQAGAEVAPRSRGGVRPRRSSASVRKVATSSSSSSAWGSPGSRQTARRRPGAR